MVRSRCDGNTHAGEVTGAEACLHLLNEVFSKWAAGDGNVKTLLATRCAHACATGHVAAWTPSSDVLIVRVVAAPPRRCWPQGGPMRSSSDDVHRSEATHSSDVCTAPHQTVWMHSNDVDAQQ